MPSSLPAENVEDWNTDRVIQWGQRVVGLDENELTLLRKEKYSGISLRLATRDSLKSDGFAGGRADEFLCARDKLFPAAGEDAGEAAGYDEDRHHKRPKNLEELLRLENFKAPEIKPRPESELFGRDTARNSVISYLSGCVQEDPDYVDSNKFSMLGVSGVKGIGKTQLLYQITERWAKAALGDKTRAVYVTYNGSGKARAYCCHPPLIQKYAHDDGEGFLDSVGHLLLVSCGVTEEAAVQIPFKDALAHTRKKMGCHHDSTLVICIDEVIELNKRNPDYAQQSGAEEQKPTLTPEARKRTLSEEVMSACMAVQDDLKGKVLFIFTAILESMFNDMKSLSGREVKPLPLNMIPLSSVFDDLISKELRAAAAKHAGVHQLVLSCAGHPRATVDGLGPEFRVKAIAEGTEASLICARKDIVDKCKLQHTDIDESILCEWFSLTKTSSRLRESLLAKGVLHSVGEPPRRAEFLFPLLVQHWSTQPENEESAFAFHLKNLFEADLTLGAHSEKQMEPVMYHFEAVVRKAMDGKKFDLTDFYKSEHIMTGFQFSMVTARVPQANKLVRHVKDFSNVTQILGLLNFGYIVVSDHPTETGVEYLSPFVQANGGGLVVACIQCKFVQDQAKWGEIKKKMEAATKGLKGRGILFFPLVYTTANQKGMHKETYSDGIYFVEKDVFELTKKVGLLRLHTQKLGTVLEKEYPFLKSRK